MSHSSDLKMLKLDEKLDQKLSALEKVLGKNQCVELEDLKKEMSVMRRYARLAARKLSQKKGYSMVNKETSLPDHSDDYERAAVQLSRETHGQSGRAFDVVKSLFMWKESPEERQTHK